MKFEKYERPDLEELELELEGSFLDDTTGVDKDDKPWDGGFGDDESNSNSNSNSPFNP